MGLLLGERVRLSENSPRTGHKEPQRAPNVAEGLRRAKVGDQVTRLQRSAVACWDCKCQQHHAERAGTDSGGRQRPRQVKGLLIANERS